jgi:O-antigen ligase
MVICILGFVLFKRFHRDIGDVFFFIAFLGTIASLTLDFQKIRKDPIFIAFFVSLVIPTLSWINSRIAIPNLALPAPSPFFFYSFFMFWFIAYWTRGNQNIIAAILTAYIFSVVGIFITDSNNFIGEIISGINGSRIDFNVVNAQHTSLFSGFGLIASIFLFIVKTDTNKTYNRVKDSAAVMFALFFLLIIIITQSRQVWVSLLLCFFAAPMVLRLLPQARISTKGVVMAYTALLLSLVMLSTSSIVVNRVESEANKIKEAATLELASIPTAGSVGLRIHFWMEAWPWFKDRPLLGSGENTRELVISESPNLSDTIKSNFSHLHNSHVETLVSFGLLGAALVYFLIFFPTVNILKKPKSTAGNTWKVFAVTITIFWMTVNCFESFFFNWNGIYVFSVFYGIIYSFQFKEKLPPLQPEKL